MLRLFEFESNLESISELKSISELDSELELNQDLKLFVDGCGSIQRCVAVLRFCRGPPILKIPCNLKLTDCSVCMESHLACVFSL